MADRRWPKKNDQSAAATRFSAIGHLRSAIGFYACSRSLSDQISSAVSGSIRDDRYERIVQPHFDRVLQQRWPNEELCFTNPRELVN